jgi:hypothetical protein
MKALASLCSVSACSHVPSALWPNIIWLQFYLLTYLRSWALLEKLPIVQLLKNFPAFYGTRRFISMFTRALHWSLSWARSLQSITSHPISLRSILILSTHQLLGLPSVLFPFGFPPISYMHSSSPPHSCYMPCPSHPLVTILALDIANWDLLMNIVAYRPVAR